MADVAGDSAGNKVWRDDVARVGARARRHYRVRRVTLAGGAGRRQCVSPGDDRGADALALEKDAAGEGAGDTLYSYT